MDSEEEETNNNDKECEPQIHSKNPTERIMARRLRIKRRVEALQKQKEAAERLENEEATLESEMRTPIETQVEKSMELLEKLILEGDEYVTNVKVATEAREADRREREGIGKEKLIEQLEDEANAAEAMFHEISDKWSSILKYNDPLHISDDIANQKEKCDELIQQKDALIADLKAKLRSAEINFGIDQRKQIDDVNSVARRIENQIIAMSKAYRQELQMIEEVIMSERQILIEANNKKWEELFKKRDQDEKYNAEKRSEDYWNFVKEMKSLNRDFQELYRETTIKLENDCDELQRELERIKVEALINSEKLDYNYQILKKREDENLIIRSQQKRRINKLQDIINSLRKKNNDYYKQTTGQVEKLTEEIKKISQNILDLEKKADHMAEVNNVKFQKVWQMNKKRADKLFSRILDIDRILHEQQLGLVWNKPSYRIPSKLDMDSYRSALSITAEASKRASTAKLESVKASEDSKENSFYRLAIRNVLDAVADKTGFLIEDSLNTILEPYLEKEKTLIKIDNVFSALNITEKGDVDYLLEFFIPYMYCPVCSVGALEKTVGADDSLEKINEIDTFQFLEAENLGSKTKIVDSVRDNLKDVAGIDEEPGGTVVEIGTLSVTLFDQDLKGECKGPEKITPVKELLKMDSSDLQLREKTLCQYLHPLVIAPVYVLKSLKDFLEKYHEVKSSMPSMSARLAQKRSTVSRMANTMEIEHYWKKYTEIFPPEREQLWDSLLEGLKKYHELLKIRKITSEEVVSLRKQNADLRKIFANYIDQSDIPYM